MALVLFAVLNLQRTWLKGGERMRTGKVHIRDERGIRDEISRFFHWLREMEEKVVKVEIDRNTYRISASPAVFVRNCDLRNITPAVIYESDIHEHWHSFKIVYEIVNRLLKSIAGRIEWIYFKDGGWGYCHGNLFPIYPGRVERSAGIKKPPKNTPMQP